MPQLDWIAVLVAMSAAMLAAVTDVWKFRVYNALTIPLFVSGIAYHSAMYGWEGFWASALGALFGFAVLIVPHLLGLMGAGDVKLLAALGAWLGLTTNVLVFVVSSLVAGVYALALIAYRGRLMESWSTVKLVFYRVSALGTHLCKEDLVEPLVADPQRRLRVIPYGAMLPLGIVGAICWLMLKS